MSVSTSLTGTSGGATTTPRAPGRGAGGWRSRLYRWDIKASPYAYITPFFLIFAAFGLYPLIYTIFVSMHHQELGNPALAHGVGWRNYADLLHDEFFWNALRNTFTIGLISTVPQLLMALGLAHLLNYKMRGRTFFRVAMLIPYATSVAAATLVFNQLYGRDFGMVNWALHLVGVNHIDWANQTWPGQIAVSSIIIWRWTGYNTLIYLAGMQAIPTELYEAAAIDGASRWQQFRKVTIPGLRPTILFTIIVSTIGATQVFGEPLMFGLGNGPPIGGASRQYETLGLYIYDIGFYKGHLGRAAAVSWVMFLLCAVLAVAAAVITRRAQRGGDGDFLS